MTNREIMEIAIRQSALDVNAAPEDFAADAPVLTKAGYTAAARKYLTTPSGCHLVSYGRNTVAAVTDGLRETVAEYLQKFSAHECYETPQLLWLNERLKKAGQKVCFMAEYWLPDVNALRARPCGYEVRLLTRADFKELYLPQWSNALCENRRELDMLGLGAYDSGKLVGFAACSADCDTMWQIGVDVLPEYRRQGIASALTGRLASEILTRGKVPFYCCAWSNVASARNAVRSGFLPAWTEVMSKAADYVDRMNGEA